MHNHKYILWILSDIVLEFNTDAELLSYLKDNNIQYTICNCSKGNYVSIAESRYFVTPGLLYFLQGEPNAD